MSFSLKPPNDIDLANIDLASFEIWLQAFEDFCTLSKKSLTDDEKCKLFLTIAGIPTRTLLSKLKTDVTKFKNIKDDLKKYIRPVKSIVTLKGTHQSLILLLRSDINFLRASRYLAKPFSSLVPGCRAWPLSVTLKMLPPIVLLTSWCETN